VKQKPKTIKMEFDSNDVSHLRWAMEMDIDISNDMLKEKLSLKNRLEAAERMFEKKRKPEQGSGGAGGQSATVTTIKGRP